MISPDKTQAPVAGVVNDYENQLLAIRDAANRVRKEKEQEAKRVRKEKEQEARRVIVDEIRRVAAACSFPLGVDLDTMTKTQLSNIKAGLDALYKDIHS